MEKAKLSRFVIIGLVLVNMAMLAFLIGGPGRPHSPHDGPPGKGGPKQIIIDRLHLDAEQQKKYDVMVENHHASMEKISEESQKMRNELYSFLKGEPVDKMQVDSIYRQLAQKQYEMEKLNFEHFLEIRSLCKPEQKADFDKLADDLGELFHRGGPPPPPGR